VIFDNRSGPVAFDVAPNGRILLTAFGPFSGRGSITVILNWTALLPAKLQR
jgi:hypothetical protein